MSGHETYTVQQLTRVLGEACADLREGSETFVHAHCNDLHSLVSNRMITGEQAAGILETGAQTALRYKNARAAREISEKVADMVGFGFITPAQGIGIIRIGLEVAREAQSDQVTQEFLRGICLLAETERIGSPDLATANLGAISVNRGQFRLAAQVREERVSGVYIEASRLTRCIAVDHRLYMAEISDMIPPLVDVAKSFCEGSIQRTAITAGLRLMREKRGLLPEFNDIVTKAMTRDGPFRERRVTTRGFFDKETLAPLNLGT